MRHKITRLMMYNIIGFLKIFSEKKFKNFNQIRKKMLSGRFPKFSS